MLARILGVGVLCAAFAIYPVLLVISMLVRVGMWHARVIRGPPHDRVL